ncbi:hypothetical protein QE177_09040 [Arsenophonus sp. aPb]|uniref:hypothetical protein n=1 Tax=Arsenophonus sp. aPb TaxID=3041619 RepID=UPI002468E6ED|nr:hypothetical protein [Arsenophonus sp. aPb]WGL97367.1 hypothetical protein QE177_09040 [Arsenophonus sp. aPb]
MENVDWGLVVAVLSLIFTAIVSFLTIRYTKKSLEYTKKSTDIANKSLHAAQKSIETSIEIYNKQKKDNNLEKEESNKAKLKAIKKTIKFKLERNYILYKGIVNTFDAIKNDEVVEIDFQEFKFDDFVVSCSDGSTRSFNTNIKSICNSVELFYEIYLLNENFATKLIALNEQYIILENVLNIFLKLASNENYDNKFKIDMLRPIVILFYRGVVSYGDLLNSVYLECDDRNKSLSELYNKYFMI